MNRGLTTVLLLLMARAFAGAQEPSAPSRPDLQSFRIISERNIFNPNRSNRRERSRAEREPERRVRADSVALLGTMHYDKGWFAFFDGSDSEFRKTLQAGDTIAGYDIAQITANHVRLESTNNPAIELRVGAQMRKQDDGPWQVIERTEAYVSATAPPSVESNAAAGESDIVKRLMQQREQELQK